MNKTDLINAMSGCITTNKWDVLCSFNESKINQLLAQKYQQGDLVSKVSFQTSYHDDLFDEDVTITVLLVLREPLLNFQIGERDLCHLTMPIQEGKYTMEAKGRPVKETDIPQDTLVITCLVPLAAISGDTQIHHGGSVIEFDDKDTSKAHVILHFQNTDETIFDIKPNSGFEPYVEKLDIMNPQIKEAVIEQLKQFFKEQVSEIDYSVGGLTNTGDPEKLSLKPKSFIFAASKPDINKDGSLNLYIQTENSGNPQGDLLPTFEPGGGSALPIPDGYTASLVLSSDFMANYYLKNQFSLLGWAVSNQTAETGTMVALTKDKTVVVPGEHQMGRDQRFSDDVNISFKSNPFYLHLDKNSLNISWKFTQDVNWTEDSIDITGEVVHDAGIIAVTASCDKEFDLTVGQGKEIDFNITVQQNDFVVKAETKASSWPSFMSGEGYFDDAIKSQLPGAIGSFTFNLEAIDVFAVSNLLFPGQNIFNIDTKEGFHVPRDLILFGNVSDHLGEGEENIEKCGANQASVENAQIMSADVLNQAAKNATQFINQILTDDNFANTCLHKVQNLSPDFVDYIKSQGYDFEPDQLMDAYKSQAAVDIKLWAGVYKFTQPENYKDQTLKISSKTGQVWFGNNERTVTLLSDGSFQWTEGNSIVKIKFSEHIKDDGSVDPNTFQGTITTPGTGGQAGTTIDTSGEQVIYQKEEDSKWYDSVYLEVTSIVCTLLGIPLLVKGFYDWIKSHAKPGSNPASVSEMQRLMQVQKELAKNDAQEDLEPKAKDLFNEVREEFLREFNNTLGKRTSDIASTLDPNLSIDEKTERINEQLKAESDTFVKDKIKSMLELQLGQSFDQLQIRRQLNDILNFKDEVIEQNLDLVSNELIQKITGEDYLKKCITNTLHEDQVHDLRNESQQIINELSKVESELTKTQKEFADSNVAVDKLKENLANAKTDEEKEKIEEEIRLQKELQKELQQKIDETQNNIDDLNDRKEENNRQIEEEKRLEREAEEKRKESERNIKF